jgi:hypothetical protein
VGAGVHQLRARGGNENGGYIAVSDLSTVQAVAFVETLCQEMTELQISTALRRWELLCVQQALSPTKELEIELPV